MLRRTDAESGPVFYVSELLGSAGVPHAFSTRLGGVSPAPFDSLNLGNPNGCEIQDDYDRIWENYRLLATAIGCGERNLCRVHQVHGDRIAVAERGASLDPSTQADGLLTDDPQRLLSVRVADCVPVLLASHDGSVVAAVHAGWRGVVGGVVPAAVAAMSQRGVDAGSLLAAVGPCIGFDAFEVGPEVVDQFEQIFPDRPPAKRLPDGKGRVDLRKAVRRQLLDAGLPSKRIDTTDRCTYHHADEFFSHRRDKGTTGRMAALIATRS